MYTLKYKTKKLKISDKGILNCWCNMLDSKNISYQITK